MWHEGVRWHHVESDILKEGQGQKHPGMWGIVEHQIPSIKVLFKTNAKSHKHLGIKLLSSESKTQLVNQRKQNSYTYIYTCTELLGENKGHQEETHHPPQVSALVPRPVVNGIERMCRRHGSDLVSSSSCICAIYCSQVLSPEWRCSWSSAEMRCSNDICMINNIFAH